ncbi:hypothetical protein [Acinetobacter gerneri]|uniref:hypothetical protein n=1 Tax=Acinetobacter gerneri TaxID=202952 RepID=UPI0023EFA76C|nr:hypothetical protein [Acinetobacter gerneri]MCH4242875.1 hypothetical protein [Acinetobacter gerneri]
MDKYVIIGIVLVLCVLMVIYTQTGGNSTPKLSLKQQIEKAFPQYKVIDKFNGVAICKENSRQFLEELVIIRVDAEQSKNIRDTGITKILTYSKQPSLAQIRKDIAGHLS